MTDESSKPAHGTVDNALAALDRRIEPARDLWPEIEARLDGKRGSHWTSFALAAGVCLAVLAGMNALRTAAPAPDAAPDSIASTPQIAVEQPLLPVEVARPRLDYASYPGDVYAQARDSELAALESRIAELPPGQREIVMLNLATIDSALNEIDRALSANPDNTVLKELLQATYQKELRTIATVNRLTENRRTDL